MTKRNFTNREATRRSGKRPKGLGKKALALTLVTALTMGHTISPISAQEDEEKGTTLGEYSIMLNQLDGCLLTSDKETANEGDLVTINVDYKTTFDFEGVELVGEESGENIEYDNTSNMMSFEMPAESVLATPIGFDFSSEVNVKGIEPTKERSISFDGLDLYIKDNINSEYIQTIDENIGLKGYLSTIQTYAKVDDFPAAAEHTINGLNSSFEEMGFVNSMIDNVMLFDISEESDYYVAYVDVAHFTEDIKVTDFAFARNNVYAEMVDGCEFDSATGIAYIPKSLYVDIDTDNASEYIRMQILYVQGESDVINIPVTISNTSKVNTLSESGFTKLSITDFVTSVNIAEPGTFIDTNMYVAINGLPITDDDYIYDEETGNLIMDTPSLSVTSIQVAVTNDYSIATMSMDYTTWKYVTGLTLTFDKKPTVGELYTFVKQHFERLNGDASSLANYGRVYAPINTEGDYSSATAKDCYNNIYNGSTVINVIDFKEMTSSSSPQSWNVNSTTSVGGEIPTTTKSTTSNGNTVIFEGTELLLGYCAEINSGYGGDLEGVTDMDNALGYAKMIIVDVQDNYIIFGFMSQPYYGQGLLAYARITYDVPPSEGSANLVKKSSNPSITDGSDCYSLVGAEYTVYNDENCTSSTGLKLTTTSTGSNTITLDEGVYYVKETKAPKGYLLNPKPQELTVIAGETTTLNVTNDPYYDPVGIMVTKSDSDSGVGLAGAQFTIKYYSSYSTSGTPERTWVFETDSNGKAQYYEEYKISGDELYTNPGGMPTLPLGAISIQETKAPEGYAVDGKTHIRLIEVDESGESSLDSVITTNAPDVPNETIKGGVQITKYDADFNTNAAQGGGTLEGTTFQIYNKSGDTIYYKGEPVANNALVTTIASDSTGVAKTGSTDLPYGTYSINESKAPTGYQIISTVRTFDITAQAQMVYLTGDEAIKDPVIRGGVQITKYDADFNTNAAQGAATLKDAAFEIKNSTGKSVVVDGKTYANGAVVKTIYTNDSGVAATGSTDLPYGTYTITEVDAPTGYDIPTSGYSKTFSITTQAQMVYLTGDNAIKDPVIRGGVKIYKRDSSTTAATPQGDASLAGAKFSIYNMNSQSVYVNGATVAPNGLAVTITTDSNGYASTASELLPYGTYKIVETTEPTGYLGTGVTERTFTITEKGVVVDMTAASNSILNNVITGGVKIAKYDIELDTNETQGNATLVNAEFEIYNRSTQSVYVDGKLYRVGEVVKTIYSNASGIATTEPNALPYGTYEIVETEAPEGYENTGILTRTFSIRENGVIVDMTSTSNAIKNDVTRGGVEIAKYDIELDTNDTQSGASISGAVFEITNESKNLVIVDGVKYEPGEVCKTIVTNENGIAKTDDRCLPYGDYSVQEVSEPIGYLPEGILYREFTISEEKVIVDMTTTDTAIKNFVKRGDISLTKISDGDMKRMADVPFKITSVDKGVSVTIVTDSNGYASTASDWNLHATNTNRGETCEDGVWNGPLEWLDESKGALPYGIYEVEELECEANEGYVLTKPFTVFVYKDGYNIDLGTLTNDYETIPYITTEATDEHTFSREGALSYETIIVDNVKVYDATVGETYTLVGTLMNRTTGEPILVDGKEVNGTTTFTAEKVRENIDVEFVFDGTGLDAGSIVVYEQLFDVKGELLAVHENIRDSLQTVTYVHPSILTSAVDLDNNTKVGYLSYDTTIVDRVTYTGLVPGRTYTVEGTLMDKATGEQVLVNGEPVIAMSEFVPDMMNGYIDLEFVFDGTSLGDMEIVVFEKVIDQMGNVVATHEDINDGNQTVVYIEPAISTTAKDKITEEHYGVYSYDTIIVDTVYYENLVLGREYTIRGVLMNKETGEPLLAMEAQEYIQEEEETEDDEEEDQSFLDEVVEFIVELFTFGDDEEEEETTEDQEYEEEFELDSDFGVDYDGSDLFNEVTAEITFTPETSNGSIDLEFIFSGIGLDNLDVVVFESLFDEVENEVATHHDIEDENQTVGYEKPEIDTTAVDANSEEHSGFLSNDVTITDRVEYTNLIPGREYTVEGVLMDKETGLPVMIAKLMEVDPDAEFEYEVELETETEEEETEAEEETESDEEVEVDEETETETEEEVETEEVESEEETENNEELLLGMDEDNADMMVDDFMGVMYYKEPVTASTTFIAEEANGFVDVVFTFDGTELENMSIVVFETLFDVLGNVLVEHHDIEDEDQTVDYTKPEISTRAKDLDTQEQEGNFSYETTIIDTVSYENLEPNRIYTIRGILISKTTGLPVLEYYEIEPETEEEVETEEQAETEEEAVEQEIGIRAVTSEITFLAEEANGEIDLEFVFNAVHLDNQEIVVYEKLYDCNDSIIATHEDINDDNQTVYYTQPEISTTAKDDVTGTHEGHLKEITTIIDVVDYVGLVVGREYTVDGVLMNKETNEPVLVGDEQVTSSTTFVAESKNGSVEVVFSFNTSELESMSIVVFETLFDAKGNLVVEHHDIDDEDQTVKYNKPEIDTNASAAEEYNTGEEINIVDTVTYEGLIKGQEYEVKGILMNKETNEPFAVSDEAITASATFVAESVNGEIELVFTFAATEEMNDLHIVVFEVLYDVAGNIVATHEDINDEDQTVFITKEASETPEITKITIDTNASAPKEYVVGDVVEVVDVVTYEGLEVGKEVTLIGYLMDKSTEELFIVNDENVTNEITFTPEESDGEIELAFRFQVTESMGNLHLVVFEYLVNEDGVLIAHHTDIEDEDQTVFITEYINKVKTGDTTSMAGILIAMIISGLGIVGFRKRKRVTNK